MSRFAALAFRRHAPLVLVAFVLISALPADAQPVLIEGPNIHTEAPVYIDEYGARHAYLVKVKFDEEVVAVAAGTESLTINDIGAILHTSP